MSGVKTRSWAIGETSVEVKCLYCEMLFQARVVDRRRGAGLYCSRSCKSKHQHDIRREKLNRSIIHDTSNSL